jgi:hypothetical protein
MTDWGKLVQCDCRLSTIARRLAGVIANQFAVVDARYAQFRDIDAAKVLDVDTHVARLARQELEEAGYMIRLMYGSGPPTFTLRSGIIPGGATTEAA